MRTAVLAVWTDCTNGIYTPLELSRFNFETMAEGLDLPIAIIDWDLEPTYRWGLTNRVHEGTLTFWYIGDHAQDLEDVILAKTTAMRTYLRTTGLSYGQTLIDASEDIGLELPPNLLFARQQRPYHAGKVMVQAIAGECG